MKIFAILFLLFIKPSFSISTQSTAKDSREKKLVDPFRAVYKELKKLEKQYSYWKILDPEERKNFDLFKEEILKTANQDPLDVGLRVETLEKLKIFRRFFVEQKLSKVEKNEWLHKANSQIREIEDIFLQMDEKEPPAETPEHQ